VECDPAPGGAKGKKLRRPERVIRQAFRESPGEATATRRRACPARATEAHCRVQWPPVPHGCGAPGVARSNRPGRRAEPTCTLPARRPRPQALLRRPPLRCLLRLAVGVAVLAVNGVLPHIAVGEMTLLGSLLPLALRCPGCLGLGCLDRVLLIAHAYLSLLLSILLEPAPADRVVMSTTARTGVLSPPLAGAPWAHSMGSSGKGRGLVQPDGDESGMSPPGSLRLQPAHGETGARGVVAAEQPLARTVERGSGALTPQAERNWCGWRAFRRVHHVAGYSSRGLAWPSRVTMAPEGEAEAATSVHSAISASAGRSTSSVSTTSACRSVASSSRTHR
jgi:hypothetical protein